MALGALLAASAAAAQPGFPGAPRDSVRVPAFPGAPGAPVPPPPFPSDPSDPAPPPGFPGAPGTPTPPPGFPSDPGAPAPPPGFPSDPGAPAPPPAFPDTPEAPGGPPGFPAAPRPPSVRVALRFVLQGPYASGLPDGAYMRADIEDLLPLAQPFAAAPWGYGGTEAIAPEDVSPANGRPDVLDANDVVDWVLVCIRTQPAAADAACAAALLLADGRLLDPETQEAAARVGPALPGQYHVVVRHRTHLAAMTAAPRPLADALAENVRSPAALTTEWYGDGAVPLAPGVVALVAGDGDGDGSVLATDQQSTWLPSVGQTGYLPGDFDLDGSVLATDQQVYWLPNVGAQSAVPGASGLASGETRAPEAGAAPPEASEKSGAGREGGGAEFL